jgi:hypothetical protein
MTFPTLRARTARVAPAGAFMAGPLLPDALRNPSPFVPPAPGPPQASNDAAYRHRAPGGTAPM